MRNTKKEIKKSLPGIDSERVDIIADELDRVLSIKEVFTSPGGKELIKVLRGNCYRALNNLIAVSKKEPDLPTLLGIISTYSANIDLLSQLQEIKSEDELREQLDEAVKDAMS